MLLDSRIPASKYPQYPEYKFPEMSQKLLSVYSKFTVNVGIHYKSIHADYISIDWGLVKQTDRSVCCPVCLSRRPGETAVWPSPYKGWFRIYRLNNISFYNVKLYWYYLHSQLNWTMCICTVLKRPCTWFKQNYYTLMPMCEGVLNLF